MLYRCNAFPSLTVTTIFLYNGFPFLKPTAVPYYFIKRTAASSSSSSSSSSLEGCRLLNAPGAEGWEGQVWHDEHILELITYLVRRHTHTHTYVYIYTRTKIISRQI
jgi:hypothetical protein